MIFIFRSFESLVLIFSADSVFCQKTSQLAISFWPSWKWVIVITGNKAIPYSGKFSYGAKFRIFCIKIQDAKI